MFEHHLAPKSAHESEQFQVGKRIAEVDQIKGRLPDDFFHCVKIGLSFFHLVKTGVGWRWGNANKFHFGTVLGGFGFLPVSR